MNYDKFLETYAGQVTLTQKSAIKNFLRGHNNKLWRLGAGAGKTFVRRRLIQFLIDEEHRESEGYHNWYLAGCESEITEWMKSNSESEDTQP